jgi:trans-AT polyketide synthase, acyltransferase and oxidoreductase domains
VALWVFPGQGVQRRGMGEGLFDRHRPLCVEADELLGYCVRTLCLEDPQQLLSRTSHAQPAVFVVNALAHLEATDQGNVDCFAGHSLGELNALHAAGCFDFASGVRIVRRRAELMEAASGGAMVAIIGSTAHDVALRILAEVAGVDLANDNSPDQVVLAGPRAAIETVRDMVRGSRAVRCVPLATSAAFHSRAMAEAGAAFARYLASLSLRDPGISVIANVTARPYPVGRVAELLGQQISQPVRWRESMQFALDQGVTELVEVGTTRLLTGMWRAVSREHQPAVTAPAGVVSASAPPTAGEAATTPARVGDSSVAAARLGSAAFRHDYAVRYAYLAGSMFRGVASADLVVRMAHAGLLGFFGTGGLDLDTVERELIGIRDRLGPAGRFGMNLLHALDEPEAEQAAVELFLRHDVRFVEAAAFSQVTPALVRFRFTGAYRAPDGRPVAVRHLVAKVSRVGVAEAFMRPPTDAMLARLVGDGALSADEADVARRLPVSADICVESDSAGHTDGGVALVLVPTIGSLAARISAEYAYPGSVRVGASGGLGSPEAVAAAFVLGADFIVTGSVNQCSVEAGTSDAVKELLASVDVHDTAYAPAGDLFELGARVQVVRKATLFAARANKLHQLYRQHESVDELSDETRETIERTYFRCSFDEVWRRTVAHYRRTGRAEAIEKAERNPKHKMALLFRWYFVRSTRDAMEGNLAEKVNFQIHCGPALGAFNRVVRGTALEPASARHVDAIAELLMTGAAEVLARVAQR